MIRQWAWNLACEQRRGEDTISLATTRNVYIETKHRMEYWGLHF